MTRPLRDPIIYPGEPMELDEPTPIPLIRVWDAVPCVIGGESIPPGEWARLTDFGWVCQGHDPLEVRRWVHGHGRRTGAPGGDYTPASLDDE